MLKVFCVLLAMSQGFLAYLRNIYTHVNTVKQLSRLMWYSNCSLFIHKLTWFTFTWSSGFWTRRVQVSPSFRHCSDDANLSRCRLLHLSPLPSLLPLSIATASVTLPFSGKETMLQHPADHNDLLGEREDHIGSGYLQSKWQREQAATAQQWPLMSKVDSCNFLSKP